jgi:hypothetical protein
LPHTGNRWPSEEDIVPGVHSVAERAGEHVVEAGGAIGVQADPAPGGDLRRGDLEPGALRGLGAAVAVEFEQLASPQVGAGVKFFDSNPGFLFRSYSTPYIRYVADEAIGGRCASRCACAGCTARIRSTL